jgi:sporulation protein YlmC with PRC-barrel domain
MAEAESSSASATSAKPLIESDRVEGTTVYGAGGERIGTIKRLMIEKISGRVAYAVVEFGFWEIGEDEHTIPWSKLEYDTSLGGYRTDITETDVRQAPAFTPDEEHDWSDREREERLHDFYRIPPYWRAI